LSLTREKENNFSVLENKVLGKSAESCGRRKVLRKLHEQKLLNSQRLYLGHPQIKNKMDAKSY